MQRLEIVADLAARLRRAEAEASELEARAAALAAPAPEYPQEWADEEADLLEGLAQYFASSLWGEHRDTVSLLARVRDVTSGRMIRPCSDTRLEWRMYVPRQYVRVGKGMPADEVADMLGFDDEDDLLRAIIREAEQGAGYTHGQAMQEAREAARRDPDYVAMVAAHRADHEASMLAWEAAQERAAGYRDAAAVQARLSDAIRQALAILCRAPLAAAGRHEPETAPALPTRAERKAAAASSLGEAVAEVAAAVADEARRIAMETGEGAAIAAGWIADPIRAMWAEARREVRSQLGMDGRHTRPRPAPAAMWRSLADAMEGRWAA